MPQTVEIINLTHGHATDSSSENLGDQTTASIAPSNGKLVLVAVGFNHPSGSVTTPTVAGLSMTWTQIATVPAGTNDLRMTLFAGVANGNSGTLTIGVAGQQQQNIYWGVVQVNNADVSGINGANAIVQSATNTDTNTTFTVTLGAFADGGNATFGSVYNNSGQDTTPGSGFVEIAEANAAHDLESEYKTTNDTSVDWTVSGASKYVAVAIEIKAAADIGGDAAYFI